MSGERLDALIAGRRRAEMIGGLRRLGRVPGGRQGNGGAVEHCDLCGAELSAEHRHLLHLSERRILCACESCVALRSGDAELRPTGTRVILLDDFELSDERWAALSIPIGLAFFLRSSTTSGVVAFYPSPAGATESELDLRSWEQLVADNPELGGLEADVEGLIVDRTGERPRYAIAPIDECYRLVGLIKLVWDGISGGPGVEEAIARFFDELGEHDRAGS
jgi:hypothetical protein